MTDLSDFLLARIAEDQEAARLGNWLGMALDAEQNARVLAECDAKRRIVEHHGPHRGDDEFALCAICTEVGPEAQGWPCLTLKALAIPYASHPDYRAEWKP